MATERPTGAGRDPLSFFHEINELRTDAPALAEPIDRALARIVDFVITFAVYILVSNTFYGLIAEPPPPDATIVTGRAPEGEPIAAPNHTNTAESWIAGLSGAAVAMAVLAVTEVVSGRSIGKRLLKLRIVTASGFERPTARQSWLRFLALSAPLVAVFIWWTASFMTGVGLLAMISFIAVLLLVPGRLFFDNDRQGLHDLLAGTRVVVERYDTADGNFFQRLRRA